MKNRSHKRMYLWLPIALVAALTSPRLGIAAERISLTNGFDVVCDHHAVVSGHVRVFLKADTPDYFELKPNEVSRFEAVANPPAPDVPANEEAIVGSLAPAALVAPQSRSLDPRLSPTDLHLLLSKAGSEHNVDEDLLASIVKAESGGNARARSRVGAQGLMQLMPGTARLLGVDDSYAPDQNVRGGTTYLDSLLTRFHDNIPLAVAAYNAGPEAVERYHGIPPYHETRVYVARVIHEFNRRVTARQHLAAESLATGLVGIQ